MARRDYCCCQLNSLCFFGCFLCSHLSVARRGALQAPCTHLAIYSQTQQPCSLSSWKWNPLEQKLQPCKVSWRKVWCKCLGPSVLWGGVIVVVAGLVVLLISLEIQSTLEMWLFLSLHMGPQKDLFVFFFPFFSLYWLFRVNLLKQR